MPVRKHLLTCIRMIKETHLLLRAMNLQSQRQSHVGTSSVALGASSLQKLYVMASTPTFRRVVPQAPGLLINN